MAVCYSLRSFQNKHVNVFSYRKAGVQIVNKIETAKVSGCNDNAKNIWTFCVKNKIWITAAHIRVAQNVTANYDPRKSYKDADQVLNFAIFQKAIKHQKLEPDLDCFALRLNTPLSKYISYKAGPYTYFL